MTTALIRSSRALAACAMFGTLAGNAFAAPSWDLDACSSSATPYTNCVGSGTGLNGVTVTIKAYDTTSGTDTFNAAGINSGGGWIGVNSKSASGTVENSNSPNHAIDNMGSTSAAGTNGAAYGELVHLNFSKAVDLSGLVASWANDTGGDADFLVFRYNFNTTTPTPTITSLTANQLPTTVNTASNGWQLVASSDFFGALSQSIGDGTYYSSHWLISTALMTYGNDAFKLGTVSAAAVCTQTVTNNGTQCGPSTSTGTPEPMSLALFGIAALGAGAARRRAKALRA